MSFEKFLHERIEEKIGSTAAWLTTAMVCDPGRGLVALESYVFFREDAVHEHEIVFWADGPHDEAALRVRGLDLTRMLYLRKRESLRANRRWHPQSDEPMRFMSEEAHPFHMLCLDKRFYDRLWEIQDWTVSSGLRATLAAITAYHSDPFEASQISRVVSAGGEGRTTFPGTQPAW